MSTFPAMPGAAVSVRRPCRRCRLRCLDLWYTQDMEKCQKIFSGRSAPLLPATALSVILFAESALSAIIVTSRPTSSVPVSETVPLAASVTPQDGLGSVELWFAPQGESIDDVAGNHVTLESATPGTYNVDFPFLPPGEYNWRLKATMTDGTEEFSPLYSHTVTGPETMSISRTHHNKYINARQADRYPEYYVKSNGWLRVSGGSSSEGYKYETVVPDDGGKWLAEGCGWAKGPNASDNTPTSAGPTRVSDDASGHSFPLIYFYNLDGNLMPYVRSPRLEGGVGAISFKAKNSEGDTVSSIAVEVSRSKSDSPPDASWERVADYALNVGKTWHITNVVNDASVTYIRIVRSGKYQGGAFDSLISIGSIQISRPSADVVLGESMRNPGYPSADEPVKVRCQVRNADNAIPAFGRRLSVHYKWNAAAEAAISGVWSSTNMVLKSVDGDLETYEGEIPRDAAVRAGFMHYYFRCDFDGHYGMPSQIIGKRIFNAGATVAEPPSPQDTLHCVYPVRSFKSRFESMNLVVEKDGAYTLEYPMDLCGDNEWQVTVPVNAGEDVRSYFSGSLGYTNDAPGFVEEYCFYGDNDQSRLTTPTGGSPEREFRPAEDDPPPSINPVCVRPADAGFFLYRLVDAPLGREQDLDYVVKRGVFQSFDGWNPYDYFTTSYGLAGVQTFTEDFSLWDADRFYAMDMRTETFDFDDADYADLTERTRYDSYSEREVTTYSQWYRSKSRIVPERHLGTNEYEVSNHLILDQGGTVGNTAQAMPIGVEAVSFTARSAVSDRNFAIYTGSDLSAWTPSATPQYFKFRFNVLKDDRAPTHNSVSMILCYRLPLGATTPGYYEVRFSQVDCTTYSGANPNDNATRIEVWRHNVNAPPGELVPVGLWEGNKINEYNFKKADDYSFQNDINFQVQVKHLQNNLGNLGSKDRIEIYTSLGGATFIDLVEDGAFVDGGTVGVSSFDCLPRIHFFESWGPEPESVTFNKYKTSFSTTTTPQDWYLGGETSFDPSKTRWYVDTSAASPVLKRRVPSVKVDVYASDALPGQSIPVSGEMAQVGSVTLSSIKPVNCSVPVKAWNNKFVQLHVSDGDSAAAIDSIGVNSWRGVSRTQNSYASFYDGWTTQEEQGAWYDSGENNGWAVTEGWVTNSASGALSVELERSRANPALSQAIYTPLLENGLNFMRFEYKVSGGRAVYAIERSSEANHTLWETVSVYTNEAGQAGSRHKNIEVNYPGEQIRGRIRLLPESDGGAKLSIGGITVQDFPPPDDNSWSAYNAMISSNDLSRVFSGQSCYLNDNYREGIAAGGEDLSASIPYVQSPRMPNGVGEIAFMYRPYDNISTGKISIALSRTGEEDDWTVVRELDLTGTSYVKFSDPKIYETSYRYVRLYGSINDDDPYSHPLPSRRAAIDNILITEPMRPEYKIRRVSVFPAQPIAGTNVTIEAEIGDVLLNPRGIALYASYFEGDSPWGYTNWWKRLGSVPHVQLHKVGEASSRVYRTEEGEGLPAMTPGATMQYVVWGVHSEIDASSADVIFQDRESFVLPEWYGDADINREKEDEGFSPYFLIYSCPPGSVWINEVWLYRATGSSETGCEYVEICGPAGTDIGGWELRTYPYSSATKPNTVQKIPSGTKLPSDHNGWGFYVIGDDLTPNVDLVAKKKDGVNDCLSTVQDLFLAQRGGIELVREGGIVEQRVSSGATASMVNTLVKNGFPYIGSRPLKSIGTSLSLTGTGSAYAYTNFYGQEYFWNAAANTPGTVNEGQTLRRLSDAATYWFTSVINPAKAYGRQDGKSTLLRFEVESGASTSVVYVADSWYRIEALESNSASVGAASGRESYVFSVEGISGDISNEVSFAAIDSSTPDKYGNRWSDRLLSWFRSNGWSEDEIHQGDGDGLGIEEEYLLGTSPVVFSEVECLIRDFALSDASATVTMGLTRRESGVDLANPVNGSVAIYGSTELGAAAQWSRIAVSGEGTAFANGREETQGFNLHDAPGLKFFKWKIE